jgi:hypothetical protein
METTHTKPAADNIGKQDWLPIIREHVNSLRFGSVQITVHDAAVQHVEKIERVRLDKRRS